MLLITVCQGMQLPKAATTSVMASGIGQGRELDSAGKLALKHREYFALQESSSKDGSTSLSIRVSHQHSRQGPVMLAEGHMPPALHCVCDGAVGGGWLKQGR